MNWKVDPHDSRPPYDQLRVQIIDEIRSGRLSVGSRLPTVRQLASDAGVAVNTAARTYRELEESGMIRTRGRSGSFVHGDPGSVETLAAEYTRDYLERMHKIGMSAEESIGLLRSLTASR